MNHYLAVFTGTPDINTASGWDALSEPERNARVQAGLQAWGAWMTTHAAQVVVPGNPIGKTLRVDPNGVSATQNNICGYVVVKAESHEAAAKLFENHPHFSIFPGEAVEVMVCLTMPGA
jgi:hypothetical protein